MGRRAAIVANPARAGVETALQELVTELSGRGWTIRLEPSCRSISRDARVLDLDWEHLDVDLLLTLGGDGTLLHTARRLEGRPIPIFGINLGGLGFLTSATPETLWARLDPVLHGRAPVDSRMTLAAGIERDGVTQEVGAALNDVVIHKGGGLRVLKLRLTVAGEELGGYFADGVILSTPTGATGYSLSAGGPLVPPGLDVVLVTPICAHTLAIRPVVAGGDQTIEVRVDKGGEGMFLILDGQVQEPLEVGDVIRVRRGEHRVRLAGLDPARFFDRLRDKLMWGRRSG